MTAISSSSSYCYAISGGRWVIGPAPLQTLPTRSSESVPRHCRHRRRLLRIPPDFSLRSRVRSLITFLSRELGSESSPLTLAARSSTSFTSPSSPLTPLPRHSSFPLCFTAQDQMRSLLEAARVHIVSRTSTREPPRRCARRHSKLESFPSSLIHPSLRPA